MTEPGGPVFGILVNAALLLSVAALFELAPVRRAITWPVRRRIVFGVGLGCVGVLLMANPWLYIPGIVFDVRSVLLALSGLFFGTVPTCIAMAITVAYRIVIGGAATLMGVMVIVSSGLMGMIWRYRRRGQVHNIPASELYVFGLLVHFVMLCMMMYLPVDLAAQTFRDIGIPVITIYPLVTMIIGSLMVAQARRLLQLQETEANEERLRLALAAGDLATFDLDVPTRRIQVNATYREILGYEHGTLELQPPLWLDHIHPDDIAFVREAFEAHVTGKKQEFREEFRLKTAANDWIWVLVLGRVVAWDEAGAAKRMLGTLSDITARKHAEAAVRESEEQLRQIITHSLSAIIILDAIVGEDGKIIDFELVECNDATEVHAHIQRASAIGKRWSEIDPESFSAQSFSQILGALETGRPTEWEVQTTTNERSMHCIAYRIGSHRVAAIFEDITDRKKAEEAREREATRRRILVEQAEDGIIVMDENRRIVEANRGFADMLGRPMDEVIGLGPWDFDVRYCTKEKLLEEWPELLRNPSLLETQWRRSDGTIIDVEISCNPVEWGGHRYHFDVCRNITARKRSEQVLRLQAAALSAAANAIVITDRTGSIEWVNRAWCDLTGYTMDEALGQNPRMLKSAIHDREFYRQLWATILAGEVWQSEIVNRRKDGTLYVEEEIIAPVLGDDGKPTHFVGIKQDITRRKQDEETLRESEERFRRAMVNAPFPTMLHAEDGSVLEVSRSWCDISGYSPDEIATVSDWVQKAYGSAGAKVQAEMKTLYDMSEAVYEGCFEVCTKSGELRIWEFGSAPLGRLPDGRRVALSMAMDVTVQRQAEAERNRLQEQLQQAQKMESVGRLAGGVAHDFNNMISAILGNAELALTGLSPDERIHDHLKEIVHAAERSADLTRQLLAFARRQAARPEILNLNDVIGNMLKMLKRLIGEDIDLTWHPGHDLWDVKIDPSQIDQILANLVVNARDAISNIGKITIETTNVQVDAGYAFYHAGFVPGDYVLLTVSDNGVGMDRRTLDQIFEPFFTTKHLHQGTGLGLATVYGIVKQNDGYINVYSEVGRGSSFRVYLPKSAQAGARPAWAETVPALVGGNETLLIVEDEPAIRNVVHRVLTSCGYQVILASNPEEALAYSDDDDLAIHMLITDVVLPGMNGKDLTEAILARRPNLRVLYMSGYTANVIAHHGVLDAGVDFLQKPFSIANLTGKVREVLDRAQAETH